MSFKLSSTAVIFESAGSSILVADSFTYTHLRPGYDSAQNIDSNYITNFFPSVSFNSTIPVAGLQTTYIAGGYPRNNTLQKFNLVGSVYGADVTDTINPSPKIEAAAGTSSTSEGFISGGSTWPPANTGSGPYDNQNINVIQKFPFASETNISDAGDLANASSGLNGLSARSNGKSFIYEAQYPYGGSQYQKFPFATAVGAVSSSTVLNKKGQKMGSVSVTHGYLMAGKVVPPAGDVTIEKFNFSTEANATDVGDLLFDTYGGGGTQSETHGYGFGGVVPSPYSFYVDINKFPFSADANATDVGDLSLARYQRIHGANSPTHGFAAGGRNPGATNTIDRWSLSSDENATDVGNLFEAKYNMSVGQVQV